MITPDINSLQKLLSRRGWGATNRLTVARQKIYTEYMFWIQSNDGRDVLISGTVFTKDRPDGVAREPVPASRYRVVDRVWRAIDRRLKAFTGSVAEMRRASQAYDALAAMSDPQLREIGIRRADIPALVSARFRDPSST